MIMIDTSVWVDFLHGVSAPHVETMEGCLEESVGICVCGVILMEVLQGIRDDKEYAETKAHLDALLFLPMGYTTFVRSADMYRSLRRKGITIRKPVDCLIASVCMEHDVLLLHNDRDFDPIEVHCGLRTIV
ncbi:MAG: VapC toxin family PIN domain ribonuclease [Armatimonadetes bacterium CG2_30_59_28]|nr:PIN domain nuclease [Armatimonadota bacterium]OIO92576.1 MAG: VapC toxin family PIN domain ribonuclease [Armatimonadetes bacterium CG2_30_59_28]PIU60601.1 MAG: PIN domain nuclease [Armatimonadetes bacterium CG07_land_8_20_14_0_80_59_28]PIX38520.1 MAG: PIN domain nuclease [Armatimonadetes bacterium CG_4_8_14_3_um_filter_58_9]PIY43190.1 MAG: PIN domain nuclease [Armatimonadetes bacterium CG_4_10_14_3_um_filter_59_10]